MRGYTMEKDDYLKRLRRIVQSLQACFQRIDRFADLLHALQFPLVFRSKNSA